MPASGWDWHRNTRQVTFYKRISDLLRIRNLVKVLTFVDFWILGKPDSDDAINTLNEDGLTPVEA